jgi:alkylhydroperoxidase family enzyme
MPRIAPIPYEQLSPKAREMIDRGIETGHYSTRTPHQVIAYSPELLIRQLRRMEEDRHFGLLEPRLQELVRLRSAQVNACEPCSLSRKEETSVAESDVWCMTTGDNSGLSRREQLAVRLVEKLSLDHLSIGDDDFRALGEEFSRAEIIELGSLCSRLVGGHRWLHAIAMLDDSTPVLPFEPAEIGVGRIGAGACRSSRSTDSTSMSITT